MAQSSQSSNAVANMSYVYLNQLEVGKQAVVKVMICRMWDTHTPYGKYLSSDFITSNEKMGNVIQLTAKHNIAHHFITRLKEGSVYLLKDFEVVANRDEYRILRANNVIIQLQGATYFERQTIAVTDGYIRHPFDCIEIEDLVLTEGKYLIDVVGRVTKVGSVKPQRNGFSTMEFELANERGHKIPVTLWGGLVQELLDKLPASHALRCIILTSVSVRKNYFDVLAVSSSSATMIIDDSTIPTLHDFVEKMSTIDLPEDGERRSPVRHFPLPKEGTLAELLDLVRKGKHNILDVFKLEVELARNRLQNGWYYTTCSVCKSKKGTMRKNRGFYCESCKDNVPEPITRFMIEFDVRDATGETVVVVFDELGEQLMNTTAPALFIVTSDSEEESEKAGEDESNAAEAPLPRDFCGIVAPVGKFVAYIRLVPEIRSNKTKAIRSETNSYGEFQSAEYMYITHKVVLNVTPPDLSMIS
ncbi:replication protein A 70 kDa DNA-binding subunit E-like [Rutidosis leptorrhynchoides]|uniref:replication protein A 70 kDa DNA-binding subunit E-like n=1 Tax=Rutidosis leptorrhynchoides TaxID=125765 RepID=UPI003A9A0B1B